MSEKDNATGIFGGTFDPIHLGHLQIAEHALNNLNLREIRFIPCYQPPHRSNPIASPEQRLDMLRLALDEISNKKFTLDDREIKRKGISYTIDTLQSLKNDFPNHLFYFIIGEDEFAQLNTWYQFDELLKQTNFIIVSRKTSLPDNKPLNGNNITHLTIPPIDISATNIREMLARNMKPEGYLSESVYDYIQKNGLYHLS